MGRWPAPWPGTSHFIGIGGVAMSGVAALLAGRGTRVSGSDRTVYPPASDLLAAAGIEVRTPFDASHVERDAEIVVVGNAVSRGNPELEAVLDASLPLCSLSELIERLLVPGRRVSVVAGTHGKTTTAGLLAHLHHAASRDPSFVVGGLLDNFGCGARLGDGPDLVLEGDEYDTAFFDKGPKFLHYWPRIAVLGAIEFDHADIYDDLAAVERAFALLVRMVPEAGALIFDGACPVATRLARAARCVTTSFGIGGGFDVAATDVEGDADGQRFVVARDGGPAAEVRLSLPGRHNAKNAVAALAAAEAAGLPLDRAAGNVGGYIPPRRRLQRIGEKGGAVVFDDFAHHPTAVERTLEALRATVPEGGRLIACLEPRSNTMVRRVVQEPLARALALADVVFVGPVDRPERFADEERLDVASLVRTLRGREIVAEGPLPATTIERRILGLLRPGDRVVLMSNGSFGGLAGRLADALAGGEKA
ncbi:MAG: Mur ligase family protein [Acidobacteriota bacterium]|nr:Mur ligase family protein [Acidobacteriota bacterium]